MQPRLSVWTSIRVLGTILRAQGTSNLLARCHINCGDKTEMIISKKCDYTGNLKRISNDLQYQKVVKYSKMRIQMCWMCCVASVVRKQKRERPGGTQQLR